MGKTVGVVPVNSLSLAKTRLAGVVPDRSALVLEMLARVLEALSKDLCGLWVVSPDPALEGPARAGGAGFLLQRGTGLNPALEQARTSLEADALLVALADLPLLARDQVKALLELGREAPVVLAPDRHGRGTNLMLLRPPGSLDFHFGPDSLARHRSLARARGLEVREFRSLGTERDVDRPEDLEWLWTRSA
ncbi:MAG: 2-phospho-L-lactate guanylyltransferase [Candidatus Eremiobacterota bacterium]